MRAWGNEYAFQDWKNGVREMAFPVTEDNLNNAEEYFINAILKESGLKTLSEAAKKNEGLSRAWSRLGYCYMTRYIEGFDDKLRPEADEYTDRAVCMDPLNFDVYWDRAFFYQLTDQFDLAEKTYNRARELNDGNSDLVVEQSELYVSRGNHDHALKLLRQAASVVHHDWIHWNFAWTYYFKGRLDAVFYDCALDHIRSMHWQPGEPKYMNDVLLLKAVLHARLQQDQLRQVAKTQFQAGLAQFRPGNPGWGRNDEYRARRFERDDDRNHWLEGVDLALK